MGSTESEPAIARHYDADYAFQRTPCGDVAFYVEQASRSGGPVAEFACGTGRVLLPTARAGIETVGVDISPAMLERARANFAAAGLSSELREGDLRSIDLQRRLPLVTLPFRALSHMLAVEDQLAAFANLRRHVAPDGRFVFDVFQPKLAVLAGGPIEERLDFERPGEGGGKVRRYHSLTPNPAAQISEIRFRWEIEGEDGTISEERADISMRWYFRYELEHLLARTGFAVEALYGDWDRSGVTDGSPELIFVCKSTGSAE